MPKDFDPTEGMSPLEMLLAGVGQGIHNTSSGIGQLLGMVSQDDVRERRKLDEALLARSMGRIGSVLGGSASLAPVAFVPGANTMVGAGLLGAAMGAVQPSVSDSETLQNAATFGLLGPGSMAVGNGLQGLLAPQDSLRYLLR